MEPRKFSKLEAIKFGWKTFKQNAGFFILLIFIVGLVQLIPAAMLRALGNGVGDLSLLINLVSFVIGIIVQMGLIKISIDFAYGEKPELTELFSQYDLFFHFVASTIVYLLIVVFGFALLVVPGIILLVMFWFYGYLIVDKWMGPLQALERSYEITKGSKWNLFLLHLLVALINFAGALVLFVGLFVSIPVTMLAYAYVYRKLLGEERSADTGPFQAPQHAG